jgi:hypothetical protein
MQHSENILYKDGFYKILRKRSVQPWGLLQPKTQNDNCMKEKTGL